MNLQAISRFRTAAVMATLVLALTTARPAKVSAQQYSVPRADDAQEDQQRAMNHAAHEAQEQQARAAKLALDAKEDQQRAMNHAAHEAAEQQGRMRRY